MQNKQWNKPNLSGDALNTLRARPQLHPHSEDEAPFTLGELQIALSKLKANKAPGLDGILNEYFQLIDATVETRLLQLYNETLISETTPPSWSEARVVSISLGKGSDTDPANYRPISLLNVTYKIFAAMLQARLTKTCEAKLRTTQYGFRAQRSTIHPIFVLRRAMEWSNMTSRPLHLLFWKQAFDSLDHTAMMSALERFGLPPNICKLIASLYENPTFTVQGRSDHTALGTVSSGIRQGCPLSPYLFVIVLSVIFQDLDARLLEKGIPTNTWSEGNPIYDLEYADDTLLLSLTTPQLQNFLRELEGEAQLYGMRLNTEERSFLVDLTTPLLYISTTVNQYLQQPPPNTLAHLYLGRNPQTQH